MQKSIQTVIILAISAIALTTILPAPLQAAEKMLWQTFYQDGMNALKEKQYTEAEKYLNLAKQECSNKRGKLANQAAVKTCQLQTLRGLKAVYTENKQ